MFTQCTEAMIKNDFASSLPRHIQDAVDAYGCIEFMFEYHQRRRHRPKPENPKRRISSDKVVKTSGQMVKTEQVRSTQRQKLGTKNKTPYDTIGSYSLA